MDSLTVLERVAAAPDNQPPRRHLLCPGCYPGIPYFTPQFPTAVCGEQLIGEPAPMDQPACETCSQLLHDRTLGVAFPCGH